MEEVRGPCVFFLTSSVRVGGDAVGRSVDVYCVFVSASS